MAKKPQTPGPTPAELQILLSLGENPRHGYGIKQEIEERTKGEMRLGPGTLYEAIQRLESNGYISEVSAPSGAKSGRQKRTYSLTPRGKEFMQAELIRLDGILRFARDQKLLPDG